MKTPERLQPLVEYGLVDEVIHPLMSGKEADVFVVRHGGELYCAKVYKAARQRSFRQAARYTEGRKVRNSRRARAMEKGSRYGREQQEEAWQSAEVSALYRLAEADVRVPAPLAFVEGVLLMELVVDEAGEVAPRLAEVSMSAEQAREDFELMLRYITRMLCAGLVHGDLSEFNVLVDAGGPVIIDLPQAVDAASNNNAMAMFVRDVRRMTQYYGQFAAELLETRYAEEIWGRFEAGDLEPESPLSGTVEDLPRDADVDAVMQEIRAVYREHQLDQARRQQADEEG